jgi:hypothetical protein
MAAAPDGSLPAPTAFKRAGRRGPPRSGFARFRRAAEWETTLGGAVGVTCPGANNRSAVVGSTSGGNNGEATEDSLVC